MNMKPIFCVLPAYEQTGNARVGLNYASFASTAENLTICQILTKYREQLTPKFREAGVAYYKDYTYAELSKILLAAEQSGKVAKIAQFDLDFLTEQENLDKKTTGSGLLKEVRLLKTA